MKLIPPNATALVNASSETRDGESRRQPGSRKGKQEEKKAELPIATETRKEESPEEVTPAESQLLDSKTVIELMAPPPTSKAVAVATFSRQVKRPKAASSKVVDEKKLNRQA